MENRSAKPIPAAAEPPTSRGQGLAEPIEAWAVEGMSGSESRFDAVGASRMREQDIGVCATARARRGKTRLVGPELAHNGLLANEQMARAV
jgi:hypothetical protein